MDTPPGPGSGPDGSQAACGFAPMDAFGLLMGEQMQAAEAGGASAPPIPGIMIYSSADDTGLAAARAAGLSAVTNGGGAQLQNLYSAPGQLSQVALLIWNALDAAPHRTAQHCTALGDCELARAHLVGHSGGYAAGATSSRSRSRL